MRRVRVTVGILALSLFVGGLALGQDAKVQGKARGTLPQNWGKLGLSEDQKSEIYKIQTEYRSKIEALEAKVKELRKQQTAALDKVLTDSQRARLREIIASKVPGTGDEGKKDKGSDK